MVTTYKREPASLQIMEDCRRTQPGSICNMLSKIYFKTEDPEIQHTCRMAVTVAKAMSKKLSEYKSAA